MALYWIVNIAIISDKGSLRRQAWLSVTLSKPVYALLGTQKTYIHEFMNVHVVKEWEGEVTKKILISGLYRARESHSLKAVWMSFLMKV